MAKILVVDDERLVRTLVQEIGGRMGHQVLLASSIAEGLELGAQGVDVVLLDVLLPDGNSLAQVRDFTALPGKPELLVITSFGDGDGAELALRAGAWDYLAKPLRVPDLTQALDHVLSYRKNHAGQGQHDTVDRTQIIGSSHPLQEALRQLGEAAQSDVNVLLLGETGVGKELFAKALYRSSLRSTMPFITIDCTCLPETLLESHLFGHTKGAFTGADRARDGLLLAADKGTLFLDEIGDLPLPMQGTFLRALELKRFRPIGQVQEVPSDFRLVAATNRDLEARVREGGFRADLLYRLQGLTIRIPSLRQRIEDIPEITRHVVARYCRHNDLPPKHVQESCLDVLLSYDWPGNVRELTHALERACVSSGEGEEIYVRHLPTDIRVAVTRGRMGQGAVSARPSASAHAAPAAPSPAPLSTGLAAGELPTLKQWKLQAEKDYLDRLFAQCHGDIRQAATLAGLSRGHLYELLKKHESRS